jgi:hypothetical protein
MVTGGRISPSMARRMARSMASPVCSANSLNYLVVPVGNRTQAVAPSPGDLHRDQSDQAKRESYGKKA